MSYKLLIVDDEKAIREGLAKIVDWDKLGFHISGVLADGRDAVCFLKENYVDVVLTDINMTFVSGLELAKYINENIPKTKVVIITGYKEFEYAKQAISYNVVHYLLKPTQLSELNEVFSSIKQQLDKENADRQQVEELIPFLQTQFFSDLVSGTLSNDDMITQFVNKIGIAADPEKSMCALFDILNYENQISETWKYGKAGFYSAICNILRSFDKAVSFFPVNNGEVISVLAIENKCIDFKTDFENYLTGIKQEVYELLQIQIDIKVTIICDSLIQMAHSRRFVSYEDKTKLLEQQKILFSYIQEGNYTLVLSIFDTIIDEFSDNKTEVFRDFMYKFLLLIEDKLRNIGILTQTPKRFKRLLESEDINEIRKCGREMFLELLEFVKLNKGITDSKFVQNVKDFIEKNYSKDITLGDAANYTFLSISHFGRLFKKQFNENFSDYLLKYRMTKAMELLSNPEYKVYEISEMVGYNTLKYFYKLFKLNTGMTPTEYRMKIIQKDEY